MYESHLLGTLKSSNHLFSKEFIKEQIIPSIMGKDTSNLTILQNNKIHSYLLNQTTPPQELGTILQTNIPTISEIISSYPSSITQQIYSFKKQYMPTLK